MNNESEYTIAPPMNDRRNINFKDARLIWVDSTWNKPGGWMAPGGKIITNKHDAVAYCVKMQEVIDSTRKMIE